jgi:hypothetical protein
MIKYLYCGFETLLNWRHVLWKESKHLKLLLCVRVQKTVDAASARPHVSPPARPAAVLLTRNVRTKTNKRSTSFILKNAAGLAAFFM